MKLKTFSYDTPEAAYTIFPENILADDIGMGEWRLGTNTLISTSASTCILLAAYNDRTKRGLVGHFTALATKNAADRSDIMQFAEASREVKTLGDLEGTVAWLGGGALVRSMEAEVEADRLLARKILSELSALPADDIAETWSPADKTADVQLDCNSGLLAVHLYPRL